MTQATERLREMQAMRQSSVMLKQYAGLNKSSGLVQSFSEDEDEVITIGIDRTGMSIYTDVDPELVTSSGDELTISCEFEDQVSVDKTAQCIILSCGMGDPEFPKEFASVKQMYNDGLFNLIIDSVSEDTQTGNAVIKYHLETKE